MQHLAATTSRAAVLPLLLAVLLAGPAPRASGGETLTLSRAGDVTSPEVLDYRWSDLDQTPYAQSYVDAYTYDDAVVTVTFETGLPTFTGHLSATGLKPNFAYQLKLVGKPEALFDPVTEGGDDAANERLGYAGRWWEVAPGRGNRTDAYYETYRDDPAYVFEAYLLFDFFLTGPAGDAELDFALDSSYHVLFWDWQGTPGACDLPLKTTTVSGSAADPAYDADVGPVAVGVYPQIERLCYGETVLPQGVYRCRILLTEESFHTSDGNWAAAMIHDHLEFTVGEGLVPPAMAPEPAYTAGTSNAVSWSAVPGATRYEAECAATPDFDPVLDGSGWVTVTGHTFTGLADGQTYHYRARADEGAKAPSAWSAVVQSTQDDGAPASAAGPLPASYSGSVLQVPFTATDAVSGVDHVELHYRLDGGAYVRYGGDFVAGPIGFTIPGDGVCDVYTVAVDGAGNVEAAPATPDATCILTLTSPPAPAANPDYVDIGTLESEGQAALGDPPHNMTGWGPPAPATHGGNYGGIAPGACRTVWAPDESDLPHEPWADIDLDFGSADGTKTLWVRYLDGASTDDQSYVLDGVPLGSIETGDPGENWYWHAFDVSAFAGPATLRIEAIETAGPFWDPYGQVAIDILCVCTGAARFEALPIDAAPAACGEVKRVDVRFTLGCEYVRGYTLRVRGDGLSFDDADVTIHDPSGTGEVTTSLTRNADDDWTIDYAIVGDAALPVGIPSDVDLVSIDVRGAASGTGRLLIDEVSVDPLRFGPPPTLETADAEITIDCSGPAAASGVAAAPGRDKVRVSWQDPADGDLAGVEIWRGVRYDADLGGASAYPDYDGLPGFTLPTRPADRAAAEASPEWELAGSVLPGEETYLDVDGPGGLPRGVYHYEVFPVDAYGLYGPPAAESARATSYLLGDLDGDGAVTVGPDVTAGLALCYGTLEDEPGWNGECDVGPTDSYAGDGLPEPDDAIDFADLMIFALNFDTVLSRSPVPDPGPLRVTWADLGGGAWSLRLVAPAPDLKGLNLTATVPPGSVRGLAPGDALSDGTTPVFVSNIDRRGLDVGLAVLGDGARIRGEGELLRVTFADGVTPRDVTVDARDGANRPLRYDLAQTGPLPDPPARLSVFPNRPNPFNPSTRITFDLPARRTVDLTVYGLDGRRIAVLMAGRSLPAGRHAATWDGRDDRGERVASGAYVYRLVAGDFVGTYKMTLVK